MGSAKLDGIGELGMLYSAVDALMDYLDSLENGDNLIVSFNSKVQRLKCEFRHLGIFLRCSAMKLINYSDLDDLLTRLDALIEDAEMELSINVADLNSVISDILGKIKLIQPEIREAFIEGTKSPECSRLQSYEIVVELLGRVLEVMKDLLSNKADFFVPVNKKIKALEQQLRLLRTIAKFSGNRSVEPGKMNDLLRNVIIVAQEAACLSYICWVDQVDEKMAADMEIMLSDLLQRIMPTANPQIAKIYAQVMKASASLLSDTWMNEELLVTFIDSLLHLIELLNSQSQDILIVEELRFLRAFIMDLVEYHTEPEKLNDLMVRIESVISETGHLIFLSCVHEKKEKMNAETSLCHLDFHEKIDFVKAEVRKIYLEASESKFCAGAGLGHLNHLVRNLRLTLYSMSKPIVSVKHQTEKLQEDLEFFLAYVQAMYSKHQGFTHLPTCAKLTIYQAEYFLNSFFVRGNPVSYYMFCHILGVIKLGETEDQENDEGNDVTVHNYVDKFQSTTHPVDELTVCLSDQVSLVINYLTRGRVSLTPISIVGMSGLGKTTLAREIYYNNGIARYFHISIWCCASDIYQLRDLLLGILSGISEITSKFSEMSDSDLALTLYRHLKKKRYLIVLDDMWDVGLWNELIPSLPEDKNGSRIFLTKRNNSVAFQADGYERVHHLRQLVDDESWTLLQRKLFYYEGCPMELLDIGKRIATGCKGLPLAIVTISSCLKYSDKTPNAWKKVAENLRSLLSRDPSRPLDILEESYRQLPDYLRRCFLYLGAFLPEEEVRVSKLLKLWIAEGLVERNPSSSSLEEEAQKYLQELIDRGLVISKRHRSIGGVKICYVPGWYHDMSVEKAEEERFVRLIYGCDELNAFQMSFKHHRIRIYSTREQFVQCRLGNPDLQSLLFFSTDDDIHPTKSYDVSFIYNRFKKLRTLDLWSINMGKSFPIGIELLVELRYLAICGGINSVPSSIGKLLNLETFLVKGLRGEIMLPDTIWNMLNLRHLLVKNRVAFHSQENSSKNSFQLYYAKRVLKVSNRVASSLDNSVPKDSSQLYNLQTFSTPSLVYGEEAEKMMRRLPALRRLKCAILESWDSFKNCIRFPAFELLSQLESLTAFSLSKSRCPCELRFPSSLKKLTLSRFHLQSDATSMIGRLPNLVVLKLLAVSFHGEIWDVGNNKFDILRVLKLDNLDIRRWYSSRDNFPCLEQLVLHRCEQLEEIPYDFADIDTLQMIEVKCCSISASNSARKIHDEQIDMGNEEHRLLIDAE